jgi:PhzF family phenazine biosynthesis protein
MNLPIYQVDAFTDHIFGGNPAAVVPLDEWLPGELMQSIAVENNLAETAFLVKEEESYHIRWFTPATEVKLCGHATLASAYILFEVLNYPNNTIHFTSLSGSLYVKREVDGALTMDFPQAKLEPCSSPQALWESLGAHPIECFKGEDYMAIMDSEQTLVNLQVDLRQLASLPVRGVVVTAKGDHCDFVTRFFAPQSGIDEDPVTGSAHCATAPYWAKRLKKNTLTAIQRSKREGHLVCHVTEDRVKMTGQARLYLSGQIELEQA